MPDQEIPAIDHPATSDVTVLRDWQPPVIRVIPAVTAENRTTGVSSDGSSFS